MSAKFVNRNKEIELIIKRLQSLQETVDPEPIPPITIFNGETGIGKTYLRQRLIDVCQKWQRGELENIPFNLKADVRIIDVEVPSPGEQIEKPFGVISFWHAVFEQMRNVVPMHGIQKFRYSFDEFKWQEATENDWALQRDNWIKYLRALLVEANIKLIFVVDQFELALDAAQKDFLYVLTELRKPEPESTELTGGWLAFLFARQLTREILGVASGNFQIHELKLFELNYTAEQLGTNQTLAESIQQLFQGHPLTNSVLQRFVKEGNLTSIDFGSKEVVNTLYQEIIIDRVLLQSLDPIYKERGEAILRLCAVPRKISVALLKGLVEQVEPKHKMLGSGYIKLINNLTRSTGAISFDEGEYSVKPPFRSLILNWWRLYDETKFLEAYEILTERYASHIKWYGDTEAPTVVANRIVEYIYGWSNIGNIEQFKLRYEQEILKQVRILNAKQEILNTIEQAIAKDPELVSMAAPFRAAIKELHQDLLSAGETRTSSSTLSL